MLQVDAWEKPCSDLFLLSRKKQKGQDMVRYYCITISDVEHLNMPDICSLIAYDNIMSPLEWLELINRRLQSSNMMLHYVVLSPSLPIQFLKFIILQAS